MSNAMNTPSNLNISITGDRPHQGRTLVAAIIAKALTEHGFSDITVVSQDGDFPVLAMQDELTNIANMVQIPHVTIEDTNGVRPTPDHMRFKVGPKTPQE